MWGSVDSTPPERLIFDQQQYKPSQCDAQGKETVCHIHRAFKTEAYTLIPPIKEEALKKLNLDINFACDLFANHQNAQHRLFCTRQNSAFRYNWSELCENGQTVLWANPPFSQLEKVVTKLVCEPCKMVLVTPNWGNRPWKRILDKVAVNQFHAPEKVPLY